MSERELHKPGTPGPWEALSDRVATDDGWAPCHSIWSGDDEFAHVFSDQDAYAIVDLWGWIERAERYEEALRRIAVEGTRAVTKADYEMGELAAWVLEEEGRL